MKHALSICLLSFGLGLTGCASIAIKTSSPAWGYSDIARATNGVTSSMFTAQTRIEEGTDAQGRHYRIKTVIRIPMRTSKVTAYVMGDAKGTLDKLRVINAHSSSQAIGAQGMSGEADLSASIAALAGLIDKLGPLLKLAALIP